jgi:FkbM family methyltransferase
VRAAPHGEVIAIEPDPDLMRRAGRNVALNGLETVRFINAAASDQPGEMRLYRPGPQDTNRARASLLHHPYLTGAASVVPVVTLDDACADGPVSLIKIDVEGHEGAVVRGAAATIGASMPSIIFEYAPELLESAEQSPFRWLSERGYLMFAIRAVRHRITGRVRLALDRALEQPRDGGNILAVSAAATARLGSLVQ